MELALGENQVEFMGVSKGTNAFIYLKSYIRPLLCARHSASMGLTAVYRMVTALSSWS